MDMAVNGFQLSQGKAMDTGSRTKNPDDNRDAMLKHEETRHDALYGTLDLLSGQQDGYSHIGGGPGERKAVEEHSKVEEVFNYAFPGKTQIVDRRTVKPKFFDNYKLKPYEGPHRSSIEDVYLNRVARLSKYNIKDNENL